MDRRKYAAKRKRGLSILEAAFFLLIMVAVAVVSLMRFNQMEDQIRADKPAKPTLQHGNAPSPSRVQYKY